LSPAQNRRLVAAHEVSQQALPYVQLLADDLHEGVHRVFGLLKSVEK
jgi:hypothetical protein